jgi:hypothetical protein
MEITVDILNELLNKHAEALARKRRLRVNPSEFIFHLEENMINDIMMTAGNPVIVRFNLGMFTKIILAIIKHRNHISHEIVDFNNTIQNCYEVGTRHMVRSLSLVPVSDHIARVAEVKRWRKVIEDKALMLLPDSSISYSINVQVTAIHIDTGKRAIVHRNVSSRETRDQLEAKLKVQARHDLTLLVKPPKEDLTSSKENEENEDTISS